VSVEPPVFAEERHQRIMVILAAQGRLRIAELVSELGVTEATLRKDLGSLERQGLLRRTHGGAIATRTQIEPTISARSSRNGPAKDRIAQACLAHIKAGDSVFLDSGTTVQRIADRLDCANVNVLTNALGVASAVADRPTVRHTLVGGSVRSLGGTVVGPVALDNLSRFTVNTAFISASGLTENGISVADVAEADVKRAVIERARRVIVPLDSAKFGVDDFITVCELDAIDVVITEAASREVRLLCKKYNLTLELA
jgi:DeoR/GlpR family transcriptional regulator of sugar metabolism